MSSSINSNSFIKPLTSVVVYFASVRIAIYPQMYISPPACQGLLKTLPKILETVPETTSETVIETFSLTISSDWEKKKKEIDS